MNEDFSDILSKFTDILKEKDIDLNTIGDTFAEKRETSDTNLDNDFSIDVDTILKLKTIFSSMNKNKDHPRNKLLKSLSPYLKNAKKEQLEQYMKIANLLAVLDILDNDTIKKFSQSDYDFILIIILFLLLF